MRTCGDTGQRRRLDLVLGGILILVIAGIVVAASVVKNEKPEGGSYSPPASTTAPHAPAPPAIPLSEITAQAAAEDSLEVALRDGPEAGDVVLNRAAELSDCPIIGGGAYLIEKGDRKGARQEKKDRAAFEVEVAEIEGVVVSHATKRTEQGTYHLVVAWKC